MLRLQFDGEYDDDDEVQQQQLQPQHLVNQTLMQLLHYLLDYYHHRDGNKV
jgi:hypothetical protein